MDGRLRAHHPRHAFGKGAYKVASSYFFEKSNQKTFGPAGFGTAIAKARRTKSFLLLFFKKEALSFPTRRIR
jgi:hypothetical protein